MRHRFDRDALSVLYCARH